MDDEFLAPRRSMRAPIAEIFAAAEMLNRATDAHAAGDRATAASLLDGANMPAIRAWSESLWGSKGANPEQWQYHRYRAIAGAPPILPKGLRIQLRMPPTEEKLKLVDHYGYNCAFCGIPVIRAEVRAEFVRYYPASVSWGSTNLTQHAAFQCMWLQFDHMLPHSRGGGNTIDNIVITCAPCNYGRMEWTLDEVGLMDPRSVEIQRSDWDGLERFLSYC